MSSIQINVTDRDGVRTEGVEWKDFESLMECLTRNKFPILATCGGNASCSTCHSYLDQETFVKTGGTNEEEEDLLEMLDDTRHDNSRLTCQVEWSEDLAGAEIELERPSDPTHGEYATSIALRLAGERASWPLALGRARHWCGAGWVLAGDAAHIHSPLGARGMNLGIEDAWVFAACAADALAGRPERLADYGRIRREVDAGVGGRAALDIGSRLAALARSHQVVVVTHLAQVAAHADRHLVVRKSTDGQVTRSDVVDLDPAERVAELARMMGGDEGETARAHAQQLFDDAQTAVADARAEGTAR